MGLQAWPSVFVLCLIWFIPESPRWYIAQGNDQRAHELLAKYHSEGDMNSEIVRLEMAQMKAAIELNGSDKRWWDYRGLVRDRGQRYRFFLVACVSAFSELDLPPTSYYLPLMVSRCPSAPRRFAHAQVEAAGVTDTHTVLLLNALQTPIMMCFALTGLQFIERWGRRPSLMISSVGMTISVTMITAMTALTPTNPKAGPVGIVFLYTFLATFAFIWTPCQALYPSEVLTFENRAKGLAAYGFINNVIKVFNTCALPYCMTSSALTPRRPASGN